MRPTNAGARPGPRACLHIVGTATEIHAGWRLRVKTERAFRDAGGQGQAGQLPAQGYAEHGWAQESRGTFVGEETFAPDDIGSGTALVVLQVEPGVGTQLAAASREGMHWFAIELRDGGVGAVLVVPSVRDDDARRVVDAVASVVDRGTLPLHPVEILDLAHGVQGAVGEPVTLYVNVRREGD